MRAGNTAQDCPKLLLLADAFADEKLCSAIGELNHHRRIYLSASRQGRIDRVRADAIDRRKRKFVGLGVVEKFFHLIAEENSGPKSFVVTHD